MMCGELHRSVTKSQHSRVVQDLELVQTKLTMSILFISDLHLDESWPHIVDEFERFLTEDARGARALYILGDLFESWIGDDDDSPIADRVARALRALSDSGVPIYFMRGNRDFVLGKDFARKAGMTILDDPTVIDLDGTRTLLMHGDTLCTDDVAYQKFRKIMHNRWFQRIALALPLSVRRRIAGRLRGQSQKHVARKTEAIMDVNQGAVEAAMRAHGVRTLIHGHTHRPAAHRFDLDGQTAERIVLGDWYDQSSILTWPRPAAGR
jgi:UDP-2,3-diacylglucosamine hydrolase